MGRVRSKILFGLIFYFAGFATAIYFLAPAGDNIDENRIKTGKTRIGRQQNSKTEKFAQDFNTNMRKCKTIAEEKALAVSEMLKQAMAQKNED